MVLAAASGASAVYPGVLGFLVVAGMSVALFFLFRSMNKQLHKIAPQDTRVPAANASAGRPASSGSPADGNSSPRRS